MMPRPLAGNKTVTNTSWATMSTSTAPSTRHTTVMRLRRRCASAGVLGWHAARRDVVNVVACPVGIVQPDGALTVAADRFPGALQYLGEKPQRRRRDPGTEHLDHREGGDEHRYWWFEDTERDRSTDPAVVAQGSGDVDFHGADIEVEGPVFVRLRARLPTPSSVSGDRSGALAWRSLLARCDCLGGCRVLAWAWRVREGWGAGGQRRRAGRVWRARSAGW